jgi:DNA-binding transcriptional LysR family regulator
LAVTEAGRQLYDLTARIPAGREAAEDDGMAQSAAPRGHVRLTAPMSYGLVRVAPNVPNFWNAIPL